MTAYLTALAPYALAQSIPATPGNAYAVLIGVEEYSGSGPRTLSYAAKDTELFLRHLTSDRGGGLGQKNVNPFVTPGTGAQKQEILATLRQILTRQAGDNDVVYIVITARSVAPLQSDEVFISVAKSLPEKPDSQISLSELNDVLLENKRTRKIVFADLSGEPSSLGQAQIKGRVERRLSVQNLTGVLAGDSEASSRQDANLKGGHRVFPYLLVSGLQAKDGKVDGILIDKNLDNRISFAEIRDFLEQYVPKYTERMQSPPKTVQKPVRFGDRKAPDVLLSNLGKRGMDEFAMKPIRSSSLLAANGAFAALKFAFSETADEEKLSPEALDALDRFSIALQLGNLTGAGGARDIFDRIKNLVTDPKRLSLESARLVALLQDRGQQEITRYGTGDRFTIDELWQDIEKNQTGFRNAEKAFAMVLELEPNAAGRNKIEARRQFCLGRLAMLASNKPGADQAFTQAIELDPKFAEPHNALGVIQFRALKFKAAIGEFGEAKRLAPLWAYPRHNTALAYMELGKYAEAVEEYRAAIQKMPYYPYLPYNLAVLLQRLNRVPEAEVLYNTTLALFRDEERTAALRAQRWGSAGNAEERDAAALQNKLLHKNIAVVEVALGVLQDLAGDKDAAFKSYQEALVVYPALAEARHNLALLRKEAFGDLHSAVLLLEENVTKYGDFQPSQLALADTYLELGRYRDAEIHYRSLEARQHNSAAVTGLAKALAGEGRTDDAIQQISQAMQEQNSSGVAGPELHAVLGDLLQTRGKPQEACSQFQAAAKALKDFPEPGDLSASLKDKLKRCRQISQRH